MKTDTKNKKSLPCLRGKMGDWMYYVTLMSFKDVAKIVKLPKEIDKKYDDPNLQLGEWIQRKIEPNRLKHIVEYLKKQDQRFFNSLILGIYDGNPTWQEINVSIDNFYGDEGEDLANYFSKTFGIMTLDGTESIFAIDGQHRANSIREAVREKKELESDEITVIFVAHKTDIEGKERTRRLFSTLNKYAKPVSQSEIIALSEDNNCAIITRELVENFHLLEKKVLIIKNRSIRPENKTSFTNIMVLYDIVERILTDKAVYGIKVSGKPKNKFITERTNDDELNVCKKEVKEILKEVFTQIPSLKKFILPNATIDRQNKKTNLLFRPIGQNIFFDVLKIGIEKSKKKEVINYFAKDDFNLTHPVWKQLFLDEVENMNTEKSRQRFATLLILEKIGIEIKKTKKDLEVATAFKIDMAKI